MDRTTLLQLWTDAWAGDIWITPWEKAIGGLTAQQAAWQPAPGRHSIWQNVTHAMFWRDYTLAVLAGRPKPTGDDIDAKQWLAPAEVTDGAWARQCAAFWDSHERVRLAIADEKNPLDRLKYHLAHDAYHLGQIMQTRALQGLKPVV